MKKLIKKLAFWILKNEIKAHDKNVNKIIHDLKVAITDDDKEKLLMAELEIQAERGNTNLVINVGKDKKHIKTNRKAWSLPTLELSFEKPSQ